MLSPEVVATVPCLGPRYLRLTQPLYKDSLHLVGLISNFLEGVSSGSYLPPPGAEQTSGLLLTEGLFSCGPRGVTNITTPHRLVGAGSASSFRSHSLAISLPRERTCNIEVGYFYRVPIGPFPRLASQSPSGESEYGH